LRPGLRQWPALKRSHVRFSCRLVVATKEQEQTGQDEHHHPGKKAGLLFLRTQEYVPRLGNYQARCERIQAAPIPNTFYFEDVSSLRQVYLAQKCAGFARYL